MIGAFARKLKASERVLQYRDTDAEGGYALTTGRTGAPRQERTGVDGPPEAFVARVDDDAGPVFVSPVLEAFREWLRGGRRQARSFDVRPATENAPPAEDSP